MLLLAVIGVFLMIALVTYAASDPGWTNIGAGDIQNAGGRVGSFCAYSLFAVFGGFAYLVPVMIWYWILLVYWDGRQSSHSTGVTLLRWIGCILIFLSGSGLASILLAHTQTDWPHGFGGLLGSLVGSDLVPFLNKVGSIVILTAAFLVGLTLFSGVSWLRFITQGLRSFGGMCSRSGSKVGKGLKKNLREWLTKLMERRKALPIPSATKVSSPVEAIGMVEELAPFEADALPIVSPVKVTNAPIEAVATPKVSKASKVRQVNLNNGNLPSIELLDNPDISGSPISKDALESMASMVEQKLADFNIDAKVVGACPGPIVTRFELQLAPGVKVSKISGLSKDLARSLAAHSVRIVEVIPGKPVIGLELPNDKRETVRLKEVLGSAKFQKSTSPLAMGLGKDIAGEAEVVDLGKMPHLLVAGTTGSGKSVGVNAMILSMLFKSTPDELRLIMIDPKMLELSIYEGIPHLLTPVVTDMKEAANALRWCVREMDRRYQVMAKLGVRNIAGLNEKIKNARKQKQPIKDPIWQETHPGSPEDECPNLETMPYVVVVVDEFADMMMVVGKKVEELIARLAQKARAAGIHLILATQRPSVDVITGLIKANIPSRIAFQVSSRIDSRTILDQQGAEQLLGYGDMLYLPPGTSIPIRVHGAFVADHEVHDLVAAWRERGEPEYIDSVTAESSEEGEGGGDGERDALYDDAVQIVLETQRASISGVQRRLKIGYNRAARLLEEMETAGIVSEIQNNGMREILVSN